MEQATARRPAGLSARSVAHTFLTASGWGKAELARWLSESYHAVALHELRGDSVPPEPPSSREGAVDLHEGRIRALIEHAQDVAHSALEEAADGDLSFAMDQMEAGHVVVLSPVPSRRKHSAVHRPRMRLEDRVLSLAAADLLTYPRPLERCGTCGRVMLDAATGHHHRRYHSTVRPTP